MNIKTKSSEIRNKKVVFIDWNKTLCHSLFWSSLQYSNNEYHNTIITWLFKKNNHIVEAWMRGIFSSEEICQLISLENDLNEKTVFDSLVKSCTEMSIVDEDVITDLIRRIKKKGIMVVIATDNMDTFKRFTLPSLTLTSLFDDILTSNELKFFKYESTNHTIPFFSKYLKSNNLSYSDAILLDDSEDKSGVYDFLGFDIAIIKNHEDLIKNLKLIAS